MIRHEYGYMFKDWQDFLSLDSILHFIEYHDAGILIVSIAGAALAWAIANDAMKG